MTDWIRGTILALVGAVAPSGVFADNEVLGTFQVAMNGERRAFFSVEAYGEPSSTFNMAGRLTYVTLEGYSDSGNPTGSEVITIEFSIDADNSAPEQKSLPAEITYHPTAFPIFPLYSSDDGGAKITVSEFRIEGDVAFIKAEFDASLTRVEGPAKKNLSDKMSATGLIEVEARRQ